jgi:hypothetical protein
LKWISVSVPSPKARVGATPALVFYVIAAIDLGIVAHQVHAKRAGFTKRMVEVGSGPRQVVVADAQADIVEGIALRGLAGQVDGPSRGATSGLRRSRALDDFDLFEVERIAGIAAEVANAVDEQVGTGTETAQAEVVARRHAAFACLHADARYVAQRVA